jgi:hypothetical protein
LKRQLDYYGTSKVLNILPSTNLNIAYIGLYLGSVLAGTSLQANKLIYKGLSLFLRKLLRNGTSRFREIFT